MIRMIGGEMPGYHEPRPPAGGPLGRDLAARLPPGADVLVAGPHEVALVEALAATRTVHCLVRSEPAALALSARGRTVLCGSIAKLAGGYDAVVALDGLGRLCSAEGPQYDWAQTLTAVRRALRPGGTLLLAVENELGVHRLVDAGRPAGDDAWCPLGDLDTRPGTPGRLAAALAAEGFTVDWLAAAWPLPQAPTLLATSGAAPVGALAARAMAQAYADVEVLSDPRRLAASAVRAGLGAELAPGWVVAARLGGGPEPVPLPPVLGPVTEVAPGDLLEELLLTAAVRHDRPALRRLLTGWLAALPATAADNVLVDGDRFAVLDPGAAPEPAALHRFAGTLLAGGYAHPWPGADRASLTAILAAMAAAPPVSPPAADRAAADRPVAERAVVGRPVVERPAVERPVAERAVVERAVAGRIGAGLAVPGPVPPAVVGSVPRAGAGSGPAVIRGRREYEAELRALNQRLADLTALVRSYERELDDRDAELRRAHLLAAAFSGSLGYRLTRLAARVARRLRKRGKR